MPMYNIKKTQYSVSDFISWQKSRTLSLSPSFQRRSVWKKGAKSYLIDTIVKNMPTPIILLREQKSDLNTLEPKREVVDGQQRLRTLFSFIDKTLLDDFNPKVDQFKVSKNHNKMIANKEFFELKSNIRQNMLDYQFSVHILPADVSDEQILEIFARLNATGVKLNPQELRNAEFYGVFKTLIYSLASEQLNRWRNWNIFSESNIMRMNEVELTTELIQFIINGIESKSHKKLDALYREYDENFANSKEVARRFRIIMDSIEENYGEELRDSLFNTKAFFYILFSIVYSKKFGYKSNISEKKTSKSLPKDFKKRLMLIEEKIKSEEYSEEIINLFGTRRNTTLENRKLIIKFLSKNLW